MPPTSEAGMFAAERSALARYGFALAALLVALGVSLALSSAGSEHRWFMPVCLAVAATAWFAGGETGMVAALLGWLFAFVIAPALGLLPPVAGSAGLLEAIVMAATAVAIALGVGAMRTAARDADRYGAQLLLRQRPLEETISARERLTTELRQSEAEYRQTFMLATAGMAQLDPRTRRFLRVNPRMCEITGYSETELLERSASDLTHPDDRPRDVELFESLLRGDLAEYSTEKRYVRKDGRVVWVRLSAALLRRPMGEPERTVAVVQDVTTEKEAAAYRERFHAVVEASTALIAVATLDGKLLHLNAAGRELLGLHVEDVTAGLELVDLATAEDAERMRAAMLPALRRGEAWGAEVELRHRASGVPVPVQLDAFVVRDLTLGTPVGLSVVANDIRERRRSEAEREALLAATERARRTAEASARFVRRLQAITDATVSQRGLDDLLARMAERVHDVLDVDTAAMLLVQADTGALVVRAAVGSAAPAIGTLVPASTGFAGAVVAQRGTLVWERASGPAPLAPGVEAGPLEALAGVSLRVGDRLLGVLQVGTKAPRQFGELESELLQLAADRLALAIDRAATADAEREARAEAESANRAKDEFLAVLSHELRSPLTAMVGWISLLRRGVLDDEQRRRALETLDRNVAAQAQLIDDLLDVSRIVSGKLQLDCTSLAIDAIVAACVEATQPAASAREVTLVSSAGCEPLPVEGDAKRLEQVVRNLIENALRYTPRGGRVTVRCWREDDEGRISVEDTGVGIDPSFLPHVFDRFRQADPSSTRDHGGLGLGLSIARHIIERHGGQIAAESEGRGRGSRFTVRLPLARPLAVEVAVRRPIRDSRELAPLRLVLVEDDADTREVMALALTSRGAAVTAVGSVQEALRAVDEVHPGVVVSDISMPGEDGFALIRALRARDGGVPVIAMTGLASREDAERCLRAGFERHLGKPIDPDRLVAAVREVWRRDAPS